MNDKKNEDAPAQKKGLFSRFKDRMVQLDQSMKQRADAEAKSCCDGEDKGDGKGGGRCC